jgi:hypothetical protein
LKKLHNGLRKDGEHEFSHQITQALLARTLIGDVMYKRVVYGYIFYMMCVIRAFPMKKLKSYLAFGYELELN